MPSTRALKTRIRSVKSTKQITKAMQLVAASKMRKAQERMYAARPYAEKIRNVAAHISHANPEYRHPFLVPRDTVKRVTGSTRWTPFLTAADKAVRLAKATLAKDTPEAILEIVDRYDIDWSDPGNKKASPNDPDQRAFRIPYDGRVKTL